jgi:hypothetical protein
MVTKAERVVAKIYDDVLSSLPDDQRKAFLQALTQLASGRLSTPMQCDKPPRRRAARAPQVVR